MPAESESGVIQVTHETAGRRREVWLRGNVRPAVAVAASAASVGVVAVAAAVASGMPWPLVAFLTALASLALVVGGVMIWVASRPRLARRGDALEVRLMLHSVERVPLEIVECIFRGSEPLPRPGEIATAASFRVGTLVVRLAERAADWQTRTTFRPWGTWDDGNLVIDGRWCEPLSQATVGVVAAKLLAAKREVAAGSVI